jgi:truncated hemoglobin YjbI
MRTSRDPRPPVGAALLFGLLLVGAFGAAAIGGQDDPAGQPPPPPGQPAPAGQPAPPGQPGQSTPSDKELSGYLRLVINAGADMFNQRRNYEGCYRLFEGTLITLRPHLGGHPELQQKIDDGLAKAKAQRSPIDQAFTLRRVLDDIRTVLTPAGAPAAGTPGQKPPAVAPPDKDKVNPPPAVTPPDKDKDKSNPPPTVTPPDKDKGKDKDKLNPPPAVTPPDKDKDKGKDKDKVNPPPAQATKLWDRLGGEAKVGKIVDDFIATVGKDPKVNFTRSGKFKDIEPKDLKKELIDYISSKTGGPYPYTGKNMKDAHKGMKITNDEFNAAAADLKKVLEQNRVQPADVNLILGAVESTRKDIVEPAAPPPPNQEPKEKKDKKDPGANPPATPPPPPPPAANPDNPKAPPGGGARDPQGDKEEKVTRLSGKVALNGKPFDQGYVTLQSGDGRKFSTYLRPDGTYKFTMSLAPGNYRVILESESNGDNPPAPAIALPRQYTNPATSGLTIDLQPGDNTRDIELKSS